MRRLAGAFHGEAPRSQGTGKPVRQKQDSMALNDASFAIIPLSALALLAPLRNVAGASVALDGSRVRVQWPAGQSAVLNRLLAAQNIELYDKREGRWYRAGQHLPAFDLDTGGAFIPLSRALTPSRIDAEIAPDALRPASEALALAASDMPRESSAALYDLAALAAWAEMAPTRQIDSFVAARCGSRVLLVGANPPWLEGNERFWGERVLCPLGFEANPALPESALCEALGLRQGERAIVRERGVEIIAAFGPCTRAGLRLALGAQSGDSSQQRGQPL